MADKSEKTKARLPRGFVDRPAEDIRAVEKMTAKIREVYELYGFEPVEQPLIEYTDALGKFLPDQDRPNEGRRRPMAVAALRPHRAHRPLRRREL
jgi:histidyl-tRNA synthetase